MTAKKKRASGGAVLLKTKGNSYFSELAKKGAEKRREAVRFFEKSKNKKNAK